VQPDRGDKQLFARFTLNLVAGKLVEGGIAEQTDQVLKNIGHFMEKAGYGTILLLKPLSC